MRQVHGRLSLHFGGWGWGPVYTDKGFNSPNQKLIWPGQKSGNPKMGCPSKWKPAEKNLRSNSWWLSFDPPYMCVCVCVFFLGNVKGIPRTRHGATFNTSHPNMKTIHSLITHLKLHPRPTHKSPHPKYPPTHPIQHDPTNGPYNPQLGKMSLKLWHKQPAVAAERKTNKCCFNTVDKTGLHQQTFDPILTFPSQTSTPFTSAAPTHPPTHPMPPTPTPPASPGSGLSRAQARALGRGDLRHMGGLHHVAAEAPRPAPQRPNRRAGRPTNETRETEADGANGFMAASATWRKRGHPNLVRASACFPIGCGSKYPRVRAAQVWVFTQGPFWVP